MQFEVKDLTDEQVIAVAKLLGWKEGQPATKYRQAIGLNVRSEKVQYAVLNAVAESESEPAESAPASFGMNDKTAARYIRETFGLTPRMAQRAVNRGIERDEYHGRGYVVQVVDTSETEYDIRVFAA